MDIAIVYYRCILMRFIVIYGSGFIQGPRTHRNSVLYLIVASSKRIYPGYNVSWLSLATLYLPQSWQSPRAPQSLESQLRALRTHAPIVVVMTALALPLKAPIVRVHHRQYVRALLRRVPCRSKWRRTWLPVH